MFEIGRICIKLAGRDAGKEAVIVDILDDRYVLIDGNVRRRKCNIFHLEPTIKKIDIKKNTSHEEIKKEFNNLGLKTWETKPRKVGNKPIKKRGPKKPDIVEEKKKTTKEKPESKKAVTKKEDKPKTKKKAVEKKKEKIT
jgi:large subunit ribosomal protein L14e